MRERRFRRILLLALLCMVIAVTGCTAGNKAAEEETKSLKVMFWDEDGFFREYGDLFAMSKPNIEIEVVSTQFMYRDGVTDYDKAFNDFVEKEQPDLLMLNTNNYEKYVRDSKLMELDALIERDKYDTEGIYPALIELLKNQGNGKLYGLSSSFYGNAIFYNADLFKKYGVQPPHDGMSWQEIIDLARRFPTEGDESTRVYGYGVDYSMGLSGLAQNIASAEGLSQVNPDTLTVTINTDSWKRAYQLASDAINSDAIYMPKENGFMGGSMEEYFQSQPFLMGKVAMTINGPYILQNFKQAKGMMKDYTPFELGIVAGPVDPAEPDASRNIYFNEVFSIRAGSPNSDAAWEFIKFVTGEDYAKIKSRTLNGGLLARMGHVKEYDGVNLEAFYKLRPKLDTSDYSRFEKIPQAFYPEFQMILDRELNLVTENQKSIDDALQTVQDEGQAVLDKALLEKDDTKETEPTSGVIQIETSTESSTTGN